MAKRVATPKKRGAKFKGLVHRFTFLVTAELRDAVRDEIQSSGSKTLNRCLRDLLSEAIAERRRLRQVADPAIAASQLA